MKKLIFNMFGWGLSLLLTPIYAQNDQVNWSSSALTPLVNFFVSENIPQSAWPHLFFIEQPKLIPPYNYLLTQPLMTIGIEKYYQRTPQVREPLYQITDSTQQTYSRGIIMIIDNDKKRDQALMADALGQSTVVELGLITINLKVLPSAVIEEILHTKTPFGALLVKNHIKVHDVQTRYFMVKCNPLFTQYLHCQVGKMLYGRINTLVQDDTGQWVANVVEILSGIRYSR